MGRRGTKKKTDYGTVVFHWLLVGAIAFAIATGLRIATEGPDRAWINFLDPVLPQAAVWTEHLQSAAVLIAVSVAYILYMRWLHLRQRILLDRARLRGLLGRSSARWGTINICLYWLFFLVMFSQLVTGTLLYLGYADSLMVQMHWLGLWLILGYVGLHLVSQWLFGGAAQLLRIFRPTRHVPASRQFELADVLVLLDQQPSPSLAPRYSVFAASPADRSPVLARQFATHGELYALEPARLRTDKVAGRQRRSSAQNNVTPRSPLKTPTVHLNAFVMACVTAGLVVGGILAREATGAAVAEILSKDAVMALGADRAVLVSDPAAVGSDLLASSRVLASLTVSLSLDIMLRIADIASSAVPRQQITKSSA